MNIDLFEQDSRSYKWVGNISKEEANERINDLLPIRVIAKSGAVDIHGKPLPDYLMICIHNDDYEEYNKMYMRKMERITRGNV